MILFFAFFYKKLVFNIRPINKQLTDSQIASAFICLLPGKYYKDFFLNFVYLFGKESTVMLEHFAFLMSARGLQFRYDVRSVSRLSV